MRYTLVVDDKNADVIRMALESLIRHASALHGDLAMQVQLQEAASQAPVPAEPPKES